MATSFRFDFIRISPIDESLFSHFKQFFQKIEFTSTQQEQFKKNLQLIKSKYKKISVVLAREEIQSSLDYLHNRSF